MKFYLFAFVIFAIALFFSAEAKSREFEVFLEKEKIISPYRINHIL